METSIIPAISSVGFPIVAYVLMWKFAKETVKENTKAIRELQNETEQLRQEMRSNT